MLFVSHDRYFVNRVADHLIVFEPGGVRVIEGNYEAYQLFLQSKVDATRSTGCPAPEPQQVAARRKGKGRKGERGERPKGRKAETQKGGKELTGSPGPLPFSPSGKPDGGQTGTAQRKKHRRFPYRKLSDIEGEIFQRESRIEQINEELADQATFRDGGRVRALKQELADQQSALKKLYEHWDEASEMN